MNSDTIIRQTDAQGVAYWPQTIRAVGATTELLPPDECAEGAEVSPVRVGLSVEARDGSTVTLSLTTGDAAALLAELAQAVTDADRAEVAYAFDVLRERRGLAPELVDGPWSDYPVAALDAMTTRPIVRGGAL